MGKFTVEAESNELILKNAKGDHVIIPAKNRAWVKKKLQEGCHDCIDKLVESLPVAKEYAAEGTVVPAKKKTPPPKPPVVTAPLTAPLAAPLRAPVTPPPTAPIMEESYTSPTSEDSLNLYNNAREVLAWYKDNPQYAEDPTRKQPISTLPARLAQSLAGMEHKEKRGFRTALINDNKRTGAVLPVSEFNKPITSDQYYQREIENNILNMNAPMPLIDRRINPDLVKFYREKIKQSPDLVTIATYDPEKIRPRGIIKKPVEITDTISTRTTPDPVIEKIEPKPKKVYTEEEKRKLLKSSAVTGRVSFGTSNNRPMNSPGASGRGGTTNRLDGKGAVPTVVQKFLELFK
jgi:hypothetical protein